MTFKHKSNYCREVGEQKTFVAPYWNCTPYKYFIPSSNVSYGVQLSFLLITFKLFKILKWNLPSIKCLMKNETCTSKSIATLRNSVIISKDTISQSYINLHRICLILHLKFVLNHCTVPLWFIHSASYGDIVVKLFVINFAFYGVHF